MMDNKKQNEFIGFIDINDVCMNCGVKYGEHVVGGKTPLQCSPVKEKVIIMNNELRKESKEEGYRSADFKWNNYHGYSYSIKEIDDGCFSIQYSENDKNLPLKTIDISIMDMQEVINIMQVALDFSKENSPEE